jgi:A/G-specific adenine glycosylase
VSGAAVPAAALLAWYDRHARRLPWRIGPAERRAGVRPDPYRVWLSEIMLQQTTVAAVGGYFEAFLARWPRIEDLAAAPEEEVMKAWAGLGYYSRARNLRACAVAVAERRHGRFPEEEAELAALPGIGPYTAAAIAAIAFDRPATVVDGNVERVVARLFRVETAMPAAKPEIRRLAATLTPTERPGDFAQAMMDLGATLCSPKRPACALCPWSSACIGRRDGVAESLPVRTAKPERPVRIGTVFVAVRADGAVLLRRRPPKGLLGGMSEPPGEVWRPVGEDSAAPNPPVAGRWRRLPGTVDHTFTHFRLEMTVMRGDVPAATPAPSGHWWSAADAIAGEALPSVFRKAIAAALADPTAAPVSRRKRGSPASSA